MRRSRHRARPWSALRVAALTGALLAPLSVQPLAHASHNVSAWISVGPTIPDSTAPTGQATLVEVGAASSKPCNLWEFDISGTIPAQITIQDNTDFKTVVAKATYTGYITGSVLCRAGNGLDIATAPFGPAKVDGLATLPLGFYQQDKPDLNRLSNAYWVGTGILGIAAGVLTIIACPPCAAIAALAGVAAGGLAIDAGLLGFIASDPPDPNYQQVASAVPLPVPTAVANSTSQLTDAEALALNEWLANISDTTGQARALLAARERAWGAYNAGDATWQAKQLAAAHGFAVALVDDLSHAQGVRNDVNNAIAADSRVPSSPVAPNVHAAISALRTSGLPASMTQELTTGGVSAGDQSSTVLSRVLIEAFNQTTLTGPLSSVLGVNPMGSPEAYAAAALRLFAAQPPVATPRDVPPPAPGAFSVGALREAGCQAWSQQPTSGCGKARAMYDAAFSVVSPDGRFLYVASRLGGAIAAYARDRRTGALHQLAGKDGCIAQPSNQASQGCAVGHGLSAVSQLTMSRDGKFLYAASRQSSAVAAFKRNAKGGLTYLQCFSRASSPEAPCKPAEGLSDAQGIALSPNGRNVYVTGGGDRMITVFTRNPKTGRLAFRSCVTSRSDHPRCDLATVLDGANRVVVSKDGHFVYATAESDNAVVAFSRSAKGDLRQIGCIGGDHSAPDPSCRTGRGISGPQVLALSPDGHNIYVSGAHGLAVLARNPVTGLLTQADDATGCVSSNHHYDTTCTLGAGLESTFGVAVTADGQAVYAAAYGSNAVTMFRRDVRTGTLKQVYTCVSFDAAGCKHGKGLDHAGWVTTSPDGRFVYVNAPHSNSVVTFPRRLPALPPVFAAKAAHKHGKGVLVATCPRTSVAGCYGWITATVAGRTRPAFAYDIAAGRKVHLLLAVPGPKATTVRLTVKALEPTGGSRKKTVRVRVG